MTIKHALLTLVFTLSFISAGQVVAATADDSSALSPQEKAQLLGVDMQTYAVLGKVSSGYGGIKDFEGYIDIDNHPAAIALEHIIAEGGEIPAVLQDELSELLSANYRLVANKLGVSERKFHKLLVKYIELNGESDGRPSPADGMLLAPPVMKSMNTDEEEDDDDSENQADLEFLMNVQILQSQLNSVKNGGHAHLYNRIHQNAKTRWGRKGNGVTIVVFSTSQESVTRKYHYRRGATNVGTTTCSTTCSVASIDG